MARKIGPRLLRFSPGDLLAADELNEIQRLGQEKLCLSREPGAAEGTSPAAPVLYFRFKSMADNYVVGRQFNPTTGVEDTTDINIAKADLLRNVAARGSATFLYITETERIKTVSGQNETQVVTPEFTVDDELLVIEGPTPVFIEIDPGPPQILEQVTFAMIEYGARAWAKKAGT